MLSSNPNENLRRAIHEIAELDRDLVNKIFEGSQTETYPAGKLLFMQEDASDRVYGLLSGTVEISILSPEGDKLVANLLRPPSLLGEIGVLDGGARTATAVCRSQCTIVSLSRIQLFDRMEKQPALSRAIIELLCKRLRWVSGELGDQTFLDIEARLAKRLLLLSESLSDDAGWLSISQAELAQTLGATRESVNKLLNDWRGHGLIDIRRGHIKVTSPGRLRGLVAD